jgi:hypothetical protein
MAKTCTKCRAVCYFDLAKYCVQCGHRFGEPTGSGVLEMFKNIVKDTKDKCQK